MKMTSTSLNKTYGVIDHNKPCALPSEVSGVRNLKTTDVKGAQADTKRIGSFTHYHRRAEQVRPVGKNDDVEGSKCGSMLRGIQTVRQMNPLVPQYQLPGHSSNGATGHEVNNPYSKKAATGSAAVRRTALQDSGAAAMAKSSSTA